MIEADRHTDSEREREIPRRRNNISSSMIINADQLKIEEVLSPQVRLRLASKPSRQSGYRITERA